LHQRGKRDAYDSDSTSTSPYDGAANINGGNVYGAKNAYTDNDAPIGPPEHEVIDALKKGYWWREELKKDLAKPAGEGQADARTGFAGAIPVNKDGTANCEGVGATCEADKVKADEAAEKKAEETEEKTDAVEKEFHKIKGDVDEKKKKVEEKGE